MIPNPADRGKTADPDSDGFTNLQEYLFGASPITSTASLSTFEKSGSGLIVRWSQRASGTYVLQESATLLANPWPTSLVVPTTNLDQTGVYSGDYTRKQAIIQVNSSPWKSPTPGTTAWPTIPHGPSHSAKPGRSAAPAWSSPDSRRPALPGEPARWTNRDGSLNRLLSTLLRAQEYPWLARCGKSVTPKQFMKCKNIHLKGWSILAAAAMGGPVLAADSGSISAGLFTRNYAGQRSDFSGQVGFEFVPAAAISVTALGRSVSGGAIRKPHAVSLWDCATEKPLGRVVVSAASSKDEQGFACELLTSPLQLLKGRTYRLTSSEEKGGDPMMDIGDIRAHLAVADVGPGVFSTGDGFPNQIYGGDEQGYGVPTFHFATVGVVPELLKAGPRPLEPLIRDIETGYLMNCAFRAIRPYLWQQTPRLSGWDTDPSGGGWEEQPSGFFPNEFGFHVESFRLRDTSDQRAVTIRHRIARQTEGLVTWEFRFMLPAAMAGAAWQLRDFETAAVSIVTHGDKLCYETADGAVALAPLALGHEYGIKVVADVKGRCADIYVDGELKAKAAHFARPVSSLDCVLIKTGDAATGEMLLPMVNVHRGFAVCETFATCATGHAPADWEINRQGGSATVEALACAAKPDAFSLKLTDAATATKRFAAAAGKGVWEFKFLLPEKLEGAAAELLAGDLPAFRIVASGGNLCFVSPQGQPVPLVKDYRANLWYSIKAVTSAQTGAAEIWVNGKPVPAAASFAPAATGFDGVRFRLAGPGTMWVDDVRTYPWRDYPADYVPEPKPAVVQGGKLLGVQSCSLWKEGEAYAGWEYVRPFAKTRKPLLGWYDEGSPEVADWEIKWQVEHGIGFEMYCWYRPNDAINHPIKSGVLEHGIREGLFNARYSRLKKFAIMYTNDGAGATNPDDWQKHIVPYWIEYFFKDPRYLKIEGNPVVSIYHRDRFKLDFSGVAGARQATDLLRAECAMAGFPGVIILMELRNADANAMREMKAMGMDCCYAYTWGTGDTAVQSSLGHQIVMLPNWNEFGEGHFIMPSALAGFGYIDALREVFTSGGLHQDLVPTEAQKHRFTNLYPRD